jgi:hypothetical protein
MADLNNIVGALLDLKGNVSSGKSCKKRRSDPNTRPKCSVPMCSKGALPPYRNKKLCGRHGGGIRCEGGTSLQPCNKLAMSPTPRDGSKILRRLCIACGGGYKCIILGCKTASKKHGLCSLHGGNPSRKCRLKKVADDAPLQSLKLVFTTEGNEDTLQVTLIPISEENTIKTKRRKILDETLSPDGEIIML